MTVKGIGKPEGCKLIRVEAEIENARDPSASGILVHRIAIRGDFFAIPEEGFERIESRLAGIDLDTLAERFDRLAAEEHVEFFGISGAAIAEVLGRAVHAASG